MKLGLVREFFGPQIDEVDAALGNYLNQSNDPPEHYSMVRYHFGFSESGKRLSSGKRMRAIFCLLIGGASGAPTAALRTLMLASEVMHGASLVHDDLEDGDATRWERPTVWSRYGTNQAVNVGDAMIGMTYELLLSLAETGVPLERVHRVIRIFNAAHLRMSEGQHLDLVHEGHPDTSVERYLDIIDRKTATACECPSRASAVLANAPPETEEAYARFGRAFGMLYQIVDDYAGVWGDPETTGKAELGDVVLRKASLPVLYGYKLGSTRLRELLHPAAIPPGAPVSRLTREEALFVKEELTRLSVPTHCRDHVRQQRDAALAALRETANDSMETTMLETMVQLCAKMADEEGGERVTSRTSRPPPPAVLV